MAVQAVRRRPVVFSAVFFRKHMVCIAVFFRYMHNSVAVTFILYYIFWLNAMQGVYCCGIHIYANGIGQSASAVLMRGPVF